MDPLGGIRYGGEIESAALAHGLAPRLLAAVAAQETGGPGLDSGRNVVGDGGHGRGLFQIDDRYHAFARTAAAMDPARNADYAAGMLHGLLERYGGDVHAALSAYNAGSPDAAGTTTRWADGTVLGYADSVLRHAAELGAAPPSGGAAQAGNVAPFRSTLPLPGGATPAAVAAAPVQVPPPTTTPPAGLYLPPLTLPQQTLPPWSPETFMSEAGPGTSVGTTMGRADELMAGFVDPGDALSTSTPADGLG